MQRAGAVGGSPLPRKRAREGSCFQAFVLKLLEVKGTVS